MTEPGRPSHAPAAFKNLRQVGIEIAGISLAPGHFIAPGRDFPQRFRVVGHVGHQHQNLVTVLEREKLRQAQRDAGRNHPFERRFVGEIQEYGGSRKQPRFFESLLEICRGIVRNAERHKYHREGFGPFGNPRLQSDLSGQLIVRESRSREDRELLPAHHRVHAVDRGNAGLDEILRKRARGGIQRSAMHVHSGFRDGRRQSVSGPSQTVENAAEHFPRDTRMECLAAKAQEDFVWF